MDVEKWGRTPGDGTDTGSEIVDPVERESLDTFLNIYIYILVVDDQKIESLTG